MIEQPHKWVFWTIGLILLYFAIFTPGYPGSADSMNHYLISKQAFSDPILFLDQWNKPFFTLLSAPFAQLGYMGMRLFNSGIALLSAYILWLLVKRDHKNFAWFAPILLLAIPQYLIILPSAMTEPLFGLLVVAILFLLRTNRISWAMILIGLSPFVRQEGYVLIPLAMAFLVLVGKWKQILWLGAGSVFFGLLGWAISKDPLWLINSFPYGSASTDIYGSGSLFHFIASYQKIIGAPNAIFFLVGLISALVTAVKLGPISALKNPKEITKLVAITVVLMFLVGHSILWYKGISGSLGLIRVLASAAPAAAYISFLGFYSIFNKLLLKGAFSRSLVFAFTTLLLVLQLYVAFEFPAQLTDTEKLMKELALWLKSSNLQNTTVHYADPSIFFFADGQPGIKHPSDKLYMTGESLMRDMKVGEYIIWDAHFSPNESRLPLDSLLLNPYMRTIKRFAPERAFTVLGGHPYEVIVFKRVAKPMVKTRIERVRLSEDFENMVETGTDGHLARNEQNGNHSMVANNTQIYVTVRDTISAAEAQGISKMIAEVDVYVDEKYANAEFSLVVSISEGEQSYHYSFIASNDTEIKLNQWNHFTHPFTLPPNTPDPFELVVYVWLSNNSSILVDNLTIKEEVLVELE